MSLLIINTLPEDDADTVKAIETLSETSDDVKVINTTNMNIMHCTGCRFCMLQNPGICCLKDDYSAIGKLLYIYNDIIVISDTSLKFLSYKAMRVFERRFPFAVILSEYRKRRVRHVLRYDKNWKISVLYKGDLNQCLLDDWLNLYADFIDDTYLGAFKIEQVEELCKCILQ